MLEVTNSPLQIDLDRLNIATIQDQPTCSVQYNHLQRQTTLLFP